MWNFRQVLVQVGGLPHLSRFCSRYLAISFSFCTVGRLGAVLRRYFSMEIPLHENPGRTNARRVLGRASLWSYSSYLSDYRLSSRRAVLPLLACAVPGRQPGHEFSAWFPHWETSSYSLSRAAYAAVLQKLDLPVKIDIVPILIKLRGNLL